MPIGDDLPFSPDPTGKATPSDLMQAAVFDVLMRLNVARPCTVEKWSPPVPGQLPATVDVKSDFKYVRSIDHEDDANTAAGEVVSTETAGLRAVGVWPTLIRVPIMQWGPPTFNWRGQIPVGTTGLLIIADRCLDQWKVSGGPLDPATMDKHDIYHGHNSPTIDPLVDILGPDNGSAGFEIATGSDKSIRMFTDGPNATVDALTLIKLGAAAALGVARLNDPVSPNAAMTTFMTQVVAAFTVINGIIPVSIPVPPVGAFGSISTASTKVKAE
jgi:hypothetical protein